MNTKKEYTFEEVILHHKVIDFKEILEYYLEEYPEYNGDGNLIENDFYDNGMDIIEWLYGFQIDSTSEFNVKQFKDICSDFSKYLEKV